jgi:hypothetical protein
MAPSSEGSNILLLLTTKSKKYEDGVTYNGMIFMTGFIKTSQLIQTSLNGI